MHGQTNFGNGAYVPIQFLETATRCSIPPTFADTLQEINTHVGQYFS